MFNTFEGLRDHGIGLGKYKVGGNINVQNLNIPYVMFTFGEEAQTVRAVDSFGYTYLSDTATNGNNLVKYNSQLNQIWKAKLFPTGALNSNIVRVVIGKDDTPWVQLYLQKTDYKYYMGFFRVNKTTGAIETGIDFPIGQTDSEYWNFAVDQTTADVLYIAECKVSTTAAEVRRTTVSSKTVDWTYSLASGYSYAPSFVIAHANGSLYIPARTGELHRISTTNAAVIYKKTIPLGNGFDVDANGNAYVSGYNAAHLINSLSPSGTVRWTYEFGLETTSIAVSKDGTVLYMASAETGYVGYDRLDKINANTGTLMQRIRPAGRQKGLIVSPNKDVYMTHLDTITTPMCLRDTFNILS